MSNPFLIHGPAIISFSGGRTSGLMLYRILEAHGGVLPPDVVVVFCNTGRERLETLDFVERCSQRWGVPVVWLEYRFIRDGTPRKGKHPVPKGRHTFAVVDYASASRAGEPFEQCVTARNMLPNPVNRVCTIDMKIRTCQRYLRSLGWAHWTIAIGFRMDEPARVAKLNGKSKFKGEDAVAPLYHAKVTNADVAAFWKSHPFDLALEPHEGNCDGCFLKSQGKLLRTFRDRPDLADWWIGMERRVAHAGGGTERFRRDRPSYAALLEHSKRPTLFPVDEPDDLSVACHCTD